MIGPGARETRFAAGPGVLAAGLLAAGILLTATVIPAPFTVDEDNYLMTVLGLRQGGLSAPGTEGLSPSRELLYFDPAGHSRRVERTPVTPNAPPLYAFLALPFSYLGWRGLVLLNTLAFLGTVALVFSYAARYTHSAAAPWIAAAAFGLGGYGLEYAQGVWPHMLAVFLCTAAFVLAACTRDGRALAVAGAAGLLAGLAAGVRYQNAVVAAGVGLGVLLLAPRRLAAGAAYAAGAALPLLACSAINAARLGSWNPISKGPGYLPAASEAGALAGRLFEIPYVLWVMVVDFSTHPPYSESLKAVESYLWREPVSGAVVMFEGAKKAWLQSSPWVGLGLVVLATAWVWWPGEKQPGLHSSRSEGAASGGAWGAALSPTATGVVSGSAATAGLIRRELRAIALVVFPVLLVFGWAGFVRYDGLCFNQRYFHELTPLAAVALAFALEGRALSRVAALVGALVAVAALGGLLLAYPSTRLTYLVLMNVPLALALALLAAWLLPNTRAARIAVPAALGLCIGWGLAVHLGDDVVESRKLRRSAGLQQKAIARALPDHAALFAYSGIKVAHGPLQMERDLVILDPRLDHGKSAPRLVGELLDQDRRVFVIATALPRPIFDAMVQDHSVLGGVHLNVGEDRLPLTVYELGRPGEEASGLAASAPPPAHTSPPQASTEVPPAGPSEPDASGG